MKCMNSYICTAGERKTIAVIHVANAVAKRKPDRPDLA